MLKCCFPWSHTVATEAVPDVRVSPGDDFYCKSKHGRGVSISTLRWVIPTIQHAQYPCFCCCLLVADGLCTTNKAQWKLKATQNTPHPCPPPLHTSALHNPCITTAGRNAFPSSAAALKPPSQFIFPLNSAQLSGLVAAPAAHGPLSSAAEAFCHPCLSAPNPPRWLQSHQRLTKKQMAVTDTVCNCGQLIAEDKSEIRTKRWWPAAAELTLPGITSAASAACRNPGLHYGSFQFPFSAFLLLSFHSFQGFRAYQNNYFIN